MACIDSSLKCANIVLGKCATFLQNIIPFFRFVRCDESNDDQCPLFLHKLAIIQKYVFSLKPKVHIENKPNLIHQGTLRGIIKKRSWQTVPTKQSKTCVSLFCGNQIKENNYTWMITIRHQEISNILWHVFVHKLPRCQTLFSSSL